MPARRSLPLRTLAFVLALALGAPLGAQETATTRTPDVIYVPTPLGVVRAMLEVAQVDSSDLVYDLGCGDGRIPVNAAARHGARGVCIDIDPARIAESRRSVDSAGVGDRVQVRQADLFTVDLSPATVVTLYLLQSLNAKLRPKLFEELRPGTRVVSHAFDMGEWEPDSTLRVDGRTVHYWVIPANVAGTWTATVGEGDAARRWTLELEQTYQKVSGTARAGDGEARPIADVVLEGDSIAFTLPGAGNDDGRVRVVGTVDGTRITGRAGRTPFRATRTRAGELRAP